ncbi:uncharacterized protein VTP21DRAFT_4610 [Calcarisporiella thermophila]|uniref:uncharacterized protein n=1 Tax=Calcarisporiella thermophila TaxID=911321 RepID=UPI003741FEB0
MATNGDFTPQSYTALNRVGRHAERGHYDRETVYRLLDGGKIAHVAFSLPRKSPHSEEEEDWPFAMPMTYARIDDTVYLHTYISSRIGKGVGRKEHEDPARVCITVTNVDSLILASSAFSSSLDYRSVCVFGYGRYVEDEEEKATALKAITNQFFKVTGGKGTTNDDEGNRWDDARIPTKIEIKSTRVMAVKIETASAKIRDLGLIDNKEDIEDPEVCSRVWSGVIPIRTVFGEPVTSEHTKVKEPPEYVRRLVGKSI